MRLNEYQARALDTSKLPSDSAKRAVASMLGLAGETGSILTVYKKHIRDRIDLNVNSEFLEEELGDLLWYLASVATAFGLQLESIAERNLARTKDYFGSSSAVPEFPRDPFDEGFPLTERFPRRIQFEFVEHTRDDGRQVADIRVISAEPFVFEGTTQTGDKPNGFSLGQSVGDRLADNTRRADGYRYHDAIHFGFAAVLGWSPTTRQLLAIKRKSARDVDEDQDGARAIFAEEGVAAMLSRLAVSRLGFETEESVDMETIEVVRAVVADLEPEHLPGYLWRRAISQGFNAMRQLERHGGGILTVDLDAQNLTFEARYAPPAVGDPGSTQATELLRAIISLHTAKDAAYGDAWKKRGEVVGVIANIARKVDRLENVIGGAIATPDESILDTAIDLFVYAVKYRAFLADQSAELDAEIFGDGMPHGDSHRSDGTVHINRLLAEYEELPESSGAVVALAEDAVRQFQALEGCFDQSGWADVELRHSHTAGLALTAWSLVNALTDADPGLRSAFLSQDQTV